MFSKTVYISLFVCSLILRGHSYAEISPMLGVKGTPSKADVQRPSKTNPCGNVNPATSLDSSQAALLDAQGRVKLTVTNFDAGVNGSRKVTAEVCAHGTGENFISATVIANGDAVPTSVGSQRLVVQLPNGIQCTGGNMGNTCLMSLTTTVGYGNCVAVRQGSASNTEVPSGTIGKNGTVKGRDLAANSSEVNDNLNGTMTSNSTCKCRHINATDAEGHVKNGTVRFHNMTTNGDAVEGKHHTMGNLTCICHDKNGTNGHDMNGHGTNGTNGHDMKGHDINGHHKNGTDPASAPANRSFLAANEPIAMRSGSGAHGIRSILSAEGHTMKRSGFFSWIWA